jgi:hypothetical protein
VLFRAEWIPAGSSYGHRSWEITRYMDNTQAGKSVVECTRTDRFPLVAVADMKAYADNIKVWELISVEKAEDQAETIYEDTFTGDKLDPFWEIVTTNSQVKVNPPDNKSALVLCVAGKDANKIIRQNWTNEVGITSRPIALQPGVLVLLVASRTPRVAAIGLSAEKICTQTVQLLDDAEQLLSASPIDEESSATAKAQNRDKSKDQSLFSGTADKSAKDHINFYCFYPSGKVFCRQDKSRFWGRMAAPSKSLKLKLQLSTQDSSVDAIWPVDRVVVRRLDSLQEDDVDPLLSDMLGEAATK